MDSCLRECEINFHTHPPNYKKLYPDHPSKQDMKYIYMATCSRKEMKGHVILTPVYIYAIWYSRCSNHIPGETFVREQIMNRRIDKAFENLSEKYDRSTETFRQEWMLTCKNMGFEIHRFEYDDEVVFSIPHTKKRSNGWMIIAALLIFLVLGVKKNTKK